MADVCICICTLSESLSSNDGKWRKKKKKRESSAPSSLITAMPDLSTPICWKRFLDHYREMRQTQQAEEMGSCFGWRYRSTLRLWMKGFRQDSHAIYGVWSLGRLSVYDYNSHHTINQTQAIVFFNSVLLIGTNNHRCGITADQNPNTGTGLSRGPLACNHIHTKSHQPAAPAVLWDHLAISAIIAIIGTRDNYSASNQQAGLLRSNCIAPVQQ